MKWLIISCALIFYSISVTTAESEEVSDEHKKCIQEYLNHSQAETKCIKKHFDSDEFEIELNATLFGASGEDPNVVRTFGGKYCPKLNHSIYCHRFGFNFSAECHHELGLPFKQEEMILQTEIAAKVLAYACENHSAALVRLAPHRGFETILNFKKLGSCLKLINPPLSKPNSTTFCLNQYYCDGVSKSVDCSLDYFRDHKNQELAQFTNEVHALVRGILNC